MADGKEKQYEHFDNDGSEYKILNQQEREFLANKNDLKFHSHVERALDMALSLKIFKVLDYGENKYVRKSTSAMLWLAYSDVWKKFIRLEKLTEGACDPARENRIKVMKKLRDDYMDIANYAIDAIAMIDEAANKNLNVDLNIINGDENEEN